MPACRIDETWTGAACRKLGANTASLEAGIEKLAAFETGAAVDDLERAKSEGPYNHRDHVRLYEALGTAHAYAGDEAKADEAFDQLLALAPGHAISYTLSPKVTFLFERARRRAREPARVTISWPREQYVDDPTAIEIDMTEQHRKVAARMVTARLVYRRKGDAPWFWADYELPAADTFSTAVVPPLSPDATAPQVMELFAVAYDASGNEVQLWGKADRPRELSLSYAPPTAWYERWWVWTIAGVVIASATGLAVFAATREPPPTAEGSFRVP